MKKLNKMSNKSFDKFMCDKYPVIFQDRKKDMSKTCMCWGFNTGKGWNELIYELCEKIEILRKLSGVGVKASQVKEKYGSLRFYIDHIADKPSVDEEGAKIISEMLYDCVSRAEDKSDKTCAECGEYYYHDKIVIGRWVYDICEKCFVKLHPNEVEELEFWKEYNEFRDYLESLSHKYWYQKELFAKNKPIKKIMDQLLLEFKKKKKEESEKEKKTKTFKEKNILECKKNKKEEK